MKIKELLDVCQYSKIKLHSGYNGSLVATSRDSLRKYGDVEVLSIYPKMNVSSDGSFTTAYLYVFGNAYQIQEVKRNT
jgi:hypothetical protein